MADEKIDREKTVPLLLRVFPTQSAHHSEEDFAVRGKEPKDELQIYTWKDATLKELMEAIRSAKKQARDHTAKFSFAFVYPDKRGKNVLKTVGYTFSNRTSPDDNRTLASLKFETGDFLDVAILYRD
eukprot:TRINITY_DN9058_c0_g1_i1.p1 TRINITY_DN9058_c0_g1~~TRINITY_DN9058_c0_g1_i1.p1  ORF type:complete len:138 (+),score=9.89 TRINITY_DN9058_c0_g1_i1:36-416(+)